MYIYIYIDIDADSSSQLKLKKIKKKQIKRKTYKPVPPNVGLCRMLGETIFFHSRLHHCQYFLFFTWHRGNNPKI